MELFKKILMLRKEHGMTQDELAEALFVSRQTIYKWETGKAQPDISRLRQICFLFHVSADALLEMDLPQMAPKSDPAVPADHRLDDAATKTVAVRRRARWHVWLPISVASIAIGIILVVMILRKPKEIRQAVALGIVSSDMTGRLSMPVSERELLTLLLNLSQAENNSINPMLAAALNCATNEQMTREKAAYWLYCTHIWTKIEMDADLSIDSDAPGISMRNVYEELNASSRAAVDNMQQPWEINLCDELAEVAALLAQDNGIQGMDASINAILYGPYYTSVTFSLAQRSFINEMPIMETHAGRFYPKQKLTREEAITAAYRLYGSW